MAITTRILEELSPARPRANRVHELFEEQVRKSPRAVALIWQGQRQSYTELNSRANRLARYLRSRGVGAETLVALCAERTPEMVAGLLAVLKAGGAFVPLDPSYPLERLAYVLQDAAPHIVLTQKHLQPLLPPLQAECITLDSDQNPIDALESDNLDCSFLTPRNLAYVIYTSGSTGTPKGVAAEHVGMVNRIAAQATMGAFRADDICCQKTSLGFVDALFEILGPLSYGCPLVLAPPSTARDIHQLAALIENEHITRLITVPALAHTLLQSERVKRQLASLRHWTLSGEELSGDLLQKLHECLPGCCFTNLYGSSEVAADATYYVSPGHDGTKVPIGRPIPNMEIHILGPDLRPMPIGSAGEIHVGGVGLARGYLRQPQLTAERFIADPFRTESAGRLYKSGDLGQWRADGTIEYLGRRDQQVKIRGFRIEPAEIEAQLLRLPHIKAAAVIARNDRQGQKQLVAYIVPNDPSTPSLSPEEIRTRLRQTLPEHMIPALFVRLPSLPLTSSGKVDRRALPEPPLEPPGAADFATPLGELEALVATVWQELLGVTRVGRHDNFFSLGGHSLLIVSLLERLHSSGWSAQAHHVYETPTVEGLAQKLTPATSQDFAPPPCLIPRDCSTITPDMLPLLTLQPEHIDTIVATVPGGAPNIQDIYPLAPVQEGVLFHHLMGEQGGDPYVLVTLLSIPSRERLQDMIHALQEVVNRHDALRTAVLWEQLPHPVQVVYRQAPLPVDEWVLSPNRDPREQLNERLRPECQRLDLHRAPLLRLETAADPQGTRWYVILKIHHLVCDNESLSTLMAEVTAPIDGQKPELPHPISYRNHVAHSLTYGKTHDPEAYFRSKLEHIDEPTAPYGLAQVHADASRFDQASQLLDPSFASRIRATARQLKVSVATLFHAAWALVVARTSSRDDIVLGTVLLGRLQTRAASQRMFGMFINTLPLRLRLQGLTARELIEQTHTELAELLKHEQDSLAVAQRCSGIRGTAPLFTTLLNYYRSPESNPPDFIAPGIQVLESREWTHYPITLTVNDLGERVRVTAQADQRTAPPNRLVAYLTTALQSLLAALDGKSPERPVETLVETLAILPQDEWQQLSHSFNATQRALPQVTRVHDLFEQQVQRTPYAIALTYEEKSLTYAELNAKANRLAHYLRDRGVASQDLVAICVEPSPDLVVSLLAVWKAGAAYVPLDPRYPSERVQYMLESASPRVLLTQTALKARVIPPATTTDVISVDGDWDRIAACSRDNLDLRSQPLTSRTLAYVIYTSGSTGTPKGVMIEHASLVNFLASLQERPGIKNTDSLLAVTTVSFDISGLEIYLPLISGARLVLVSREAASDAHELMRSIDSHGITFLQATPATWQMMLSAGWQGHPRLKALCGGEALTRELAEKLCACVGSLWNLYGPTETTIWSCIRHVTPETLGTGPIESIGTPIWNTTVHILNQHRQTVPLGVVGELHIGGAGVARGYWHQPALTAQRFIADPLGTPDPSGISAPPSIPEPPGLSNIPGPPDPLSTAPAHTDEPRTRLYTTGDLARWRPDGTLEYLGRNDQQVKLRGFRIEPGEIEAQLIRHPQVKEALVMAREDTPGEKLLVAYLTTHTLTTHNPAPDHSLQTPEAPTTASLREYLRPRVPEYMIPSAFVVLERLPLTPNGKRDRRALPPPSLQGSASRTYQAPQGEIEPVVTDLFQKLLHAERIGRHDNFFELGGHSLLAMQALARLRSLFGIKMPLRTVFEAPTAQQLAAKVEELRHTQLLERIADGGDEVQKRVAQVASMSQSAVQALLRELTAGERP